MNLLEAIQQRGNATLCVSLSARPGTFGATVHNAGYRALGLPFKYVACKVDDIASALSIVSTSGIRGASISMPFKVDAMRAVNEIMPCALNAGAVNTVVNDHGRLLGYNTDVYGFAKLLEEAKVYTDSHVKVIGSGGVARAILVALCDFPNVTLYSRQPQKAAELAKNFGRPVLPLDEINHTWSCCQCHSTRHE